jgi:8-oxo-dGTP diphosphatase
MTVRVAMGPLVDWAERVLLDLRAPSKAVLPGRWDAGRVEAGETDETALARELEEELGVRPTRLILLASQPRISSGAAYLSVFAVPEWLGGALVNRSCKHTELGWFSAKAFERLCHLASRDHLIWARAARRERRRFASGSQDLPEEPAEELDEPADLF